MKVKKSRVMKSNIIAVISIILSIILYVLSFIYFQLIKQANYNLQRGSLFLSWIGIFILVYVILTWYIVTKRLFTPYMIFWLFFFIFNYGQPLMWALGVHLKSEIGIGYTAGVGTAPFIDVVKGQLYTCLCMFMFHTGALCCYKGRRQYRAFKNRSNKNIYKSIWLVGCGLGTISIIPTLYRTIKFFSVALKYGYGSLYYSDNVSQGGVTMILEFFFFPALICMLIGKSRSKRVKVFVYSIFAIYFILNLLSGDRGSWIYKIFALVWMTNQLREKMSFKGFVKIAIVGILGLNFVDVMVSIRNIGLSNIDFNSIKNLIMVNESPIVKSIFEMGGSMGIIVTMFIFPNVINAWNYYGYANTYLSSILGVVSTRILNIFNIPFVLVDNWFSQKFLGISWGAGFSMIGEAYLNGGIYIGPLIIAMLGLVIGSILYIDDTINIAEKPLNLIFITSSIAILPGLARSSTYLFFKTWFYGAFFVIVMIVMVNSFLSKKSRI